MSCRECQANLVPYIMSELTAEQASRVKEHVAECNRCAARLAQETTLKAALVAGQRIPEPSPGFEARVLAAARNQGAGGGSQRAWSTPVVGGAIAAALALGIALGVGLKSGSDMDPGVPVADTGGESQSVATRADDPQPAGEDSGETVLVNQDAAIQTVRLAFSSREALNNVTLTLELPPNVELATYPGHQQLSWKVDLQAGENVLALPLKVLFPGAGELVAHLDDGHRQKTFRTSIPSVPQTDTQTNKTEPAS